MTSDAARNRICETNVSLWRLADKKDADKVGQLRPSFSSEWHFINVTHADSEAFSLIETQRLNQEEPQIYVIFRRFIIHAFQAFILILYFICKFYEYSTGVCKLD